MFNIMDLHIKYHRLDWINKQKEQRKLSTNVAVVQWNMQLFANDDKYLTKKIRNFKKHYK